jgi:transposase/IS5 family transposase
MTVGSPELAGICRNAERFSGSGLVVLSVVGTARSRSYSRSVKVFRQGLGALADQSPLFPWTVEDLLGEHLVKDLRILVEGVLGPSLRELCQDKGGIPYDPVGLFCVWLFGLMNGVRTSRKLELCCRFDVRYWHLTKGCIPDHSTLSRFRKSLGGILDELMYTVCEEALEQGLLSAKTLAVDGTKIPASASQWRRLVKASDDEDAQAEENAPERKVFAPSSEPEAKVMKTTHGEYIKGYNVQAAVSCQGPGIVVGALVTQDANDSRQMRAVLATVKQHSGLRPESAIADKGYDTPENHKALEEANVTGYVLPKSRKEAAFVQDEAGRLRCPAGHEPKKFKRKIKGVPYDVYRVSHCRNCPLRQECGAKAHQKVMAIRSDESLALRVGNEARCQTEQGKELLKARGPTVEKTFARLKKDFGFRRFVLKGLSGARIEVLLACLALNLQVLMKAVCAFLLALTNRFLANNCKT